MRRSSKGFSRRPPAQRQLSDTGTIKSIEQPQGTGSIAPHRNAQVQADTGFTRETVTDDAFTTLQVGDQVRFDAATAADRPGYADATIVQPVGGNIAGQAITPVSPSEPDSGRGRPPGAVVAGTAKVVANLEAALPSGDENLDSPTSG